MTTDDLLAWAERQKLANERPGLAALLGADALKLGRLFLDAPGLRAALAARRDFTIEAAVTVTTAPIPPGTQVPSAPETPYESVAGRFGQGTTDAGSIPFLRDAFTNNATYVAVGTAKPDSPDALTLVSQPLLKIAHLAQVPDEFLDDAAGLESYLNVALSEGLLSRLDTEVINGDGAAGHIQGLIGLTGKATGATGGAGTNLTAIGTALGSVASTSRRRPDTVVINPADWGKITTGGQSFPPGIVVIPSGYCPAGTAIVGAFKAGAMLFRKGGVVIQMTQSHGALFAENETVIRAELRVAVVHFVPAAFALVTGIA